MSILSADFIVILLMHGFSTRSGAQSRVGICLVWIIPARRLSPTGIRFRPVHSPKVGESAGRAIMTDSAVAKLEHPTVQGIAISGPIVDSRTQSDRVRSHRFAARRV